MQDTVQYNNSVVGFQTALARQEGLCIRLPILTFQCQKICVCFWCGAAKRRHFFAVITVSEPVHEAVSKILPLVGKRIRTEQGCCGSGLLLIKAFRLRREAHQLIEKVAELVDGGLRRGYGDLAASVIGCPDTAHIPLFTQPCKVLIVNGVLRGQLHRTQITIKSVGPLKTMQRADFYALYCSCLLRKNS